MARLVAVGLLLILAVAPAVSAEPNREESLSYAWFDTFQGVLDWFFSWIPTLRSEPRKAGSMVVPSGITAPAGSVIDPSGLQSAPRKGGAMIVPSGIRAAPRLSGNPETTGWYGHPAD